ncbi:MAG: hypothetical protein A2007_00285 [Verrucomicrobia bacterium GWC2_42_7]|nr:MAG: hypothetical protein A2007_00285 [Verrucomicrobia bacterium GWC2_42_7]
MYFYIGKKTKKFKIPLVTHKTFIYSIALRIDTQKPFFLQKEGFLHLVSSINVLCYSMPQKRGDKTL